MNKINALIFAAGVVTGFLGTMLYMKSQYEVVETNDLAEESDKIIAKRKEEEVAVTRIPKVVIEANKRKEIPREIPSEESTRLRHDDPDFRWHYDLKGVKSEMHNAHPSELEAPHDGPEIEIITFEDFNDYQEATEFYDKLTISYYTKDDVLADENDKPMTDLRYVIGDEALSSFGKNSGDEMVVYVRNHPLTIDYEVVKIEEKYSEYVLRQYPDDDKEG